MSKQRNYEGWTLEALKKVLQKGKRLSYAEAIQTIGLKNMPTMYDLARIKRVFYEYNSVDELTQAKEAMQELAVVFGQQRQAGVRTYSHLNHPKQAYLWSNEYIGQAPPGHSAEGKLIMAKVAGIDLTKRVHHPLGVLGSPDGIQTGEISISKEEFISLEEAGLCYNRDEASLWAGQIQGFESRQGFMVPRTNGSHHAMKKWAMEKDKLENRGYGDLVFREDDDFLPMAMRPASWTDLGFTRNNSLESRYNVLTREELEPILE